jgi:hypothetical protein
MSSTAAPSSATSTPWAGRVRFAGVILLINGIFSVLQGLVALVGPDTYYAVVEGDLFLFNLEGWAWFNLVLGALLIATAFGLFAEAGWARITAIVLAILSSIVQMLLVPLQPWWALIVIVINLMIIHALLVRGEETRARR